MTDFIIIRGAPGVGKTTVSKMLLPVCAHGVTIETDIIRAMVNNALWADSREHIKAIVASSQLALSYLLSGYRPVVLVDTLSGGTLQYVIKLLGDYKYKIISLTVSHAELERRILERNDGFMDIKTSIWVNDNILASDDQFDHKIDTTELVAREVADIILRII